MKLNKKVEIRFPSTVRSVWFGLNKIFRNKLKSLSITPVQYTVLRCLIETKGEGLNQTELADVIFSNKNNTSSILRRMEKSGYILRAQARYDQRENIISVTSKGKSLFKSAQKHAFEVRGEAFSFLTPKDEISFCSSLQKINSKLKELQN